ELDARMADAAEEGAVLVACEVVAEDVGVAEDHVERRPQLVRHRRHELRFEPAGLLELLDEPRVGERHRRELRDAARDTLLRRGEAVTPRSVSGGVNADDLAAAPERDAEEDADAVMIDDAREHRIHRGAVAV